MTLNEALDIASEFKNAILNSDYSYIKTYTLEQTKCALSLIASNYKDTPNLKDRRWYKEMERHIEEFYEDQKNRKLSKMIAAELAILMKVGVKKIVAPPKTEEEKEEYGDKYPRKDVIRFIEMDTKSGGYVIFVNEFRTEIDYDKFAMLVCLAFVLKKEDCGGWVSKKNAERDGILNKQDKDHFSRLVHEFKKQVKAFLEDRGKTEIIENKTREGEYRLTTMPTRIEEPRSGWLTRKYTRIKKDAIKKQQTKEDLDNGIVAKLKFIEVSSNGRSILNELIKNGILEEVSLAKVRLKPNAVLKEESIREITKGDFAKIGTILKGIQNKRNKYNANDTDKGMTAKEGIEIIKKAKHGL